MNNKQELISYINGILRAYPIIILATLYSYYLIFDNQKCYYATIYLGIVCICGDLLKKLFKKIYDYSDTDYIPFIGWGPRPKGGKYSSEFISEFNLSGESKSYGMPSGHALVSVCFAVLLISYLQNSKLAEDQKNYSIMYVWYITNAVCISRILLGNHTFCQVKMGSFFGILFGLFGLTLNNYINPSI